MVKKNSVEGIRGVACVIVVFSHLIYMFFPQMHDSSFDFNSNWEKMIFDSPFNFWYSGTAAVYVFFVLSGYVLTYAIYKNDDKNLQIASMTIKRFPRLMIPAFFSCILSWATFKLAPNITAQVSSWFQNYYNNIDENILTASKEGFYIVFFTTEYSYYNPVLWTMRYELIGSLIIFFLCAVSITKTLRNIMGIASFFLILLFFGPSSYGYLAFVVGFFLFHINIKLDSTLSVLLLLLGLYFAGAHNGSSSYFNISLLFYYFMSGSLIVGSILLSPALESMLSGKIFLYLGKVSFSVYLTHMPMMYLVCLPIFNIISTFMNFYSSAAVTSAIFILIEYLVVGPTFYKYFDSLGMKVGSFIISCINKDKPVLFD